MRCVCVPTPVRYFILGFLIVLEGDIEIQASMDDPICVILLCTAHHQLFPASNPFNLPSLPFAPLIQYMLLYAIFRRLQVQPKKRVACLSSSASRSRSPKLQYPIMSRTYSPLPGLEQGSSWL